MYVLRGWFPKFVNMLHSMLKQDLNKKFFKNHRNNVSKNFKVNILKIFKKVISLIFLLFIKILPEQAL